MYAAITTLTLDPTGPAAGDIPALLRDLVGRTCPAAFAAGMLDTTVLHLPPDRIVMIAIYDAEAGALAMSSTVEQTITSQFADTLRWEDRVVGLLFNSMLPDDSALTWRTEARVLHATWATWRVHPHLRSDKALLQLSSGVASSLSRSCTNSVSLTCLSSGLRRTRWRYSISTLSP